MKAIVMKSYGTNDVLAIRDFPEPQLTDDGVMIEVYAAGLNPVDIKIRSGKMRPLLEYPLPLVPGNDIAGRVVRVGPRVTRFKAGDEVYASVDKKRLGAFAEYAVVSEDFLALKPKNLTFAEAASLPLVALTVCQALHSVARCKIGQRIFIKAGSGGVGTFAIQFAKACGLEVATTTSAGNLPWVAQLGADRVIDYRTERFEDLLRDFDIVLDSVDDDNPSRGIRILKPGGHLIALAGPPDAKFAQQFGLNPILQFACFVLSFRETLLSRLAGIHYSFIFVKPSGAQLDTVTQFIEQGKIKAVVDRVFPFQQYGKAFDYLATGRTKGKVVLSLKE